MNPLILQYSVKPTEDNFNYPPIIYDENLNLSVDTTTGLPAIDSLNMSTVTFTRTHNEASDTDDNNLRMMMGTITKTSYQIEGTDEDANFSSIRTLLGTTTLTLVSTERTDSDH